MNQLVGKAAEEDDMFWGQDMFNENEEDKSYESKNESDSSAGRDSFDSDFSEESRKKNEEEDEEGNNTEANTTMKRFKEDDEEEAGERKKKKQVGFVEVKKKKKKKREEKLERKSKDQTDNELRKSERLVKKYPFGKVPKKKLKKVDDQN